MKRLINFVLCGAIAMSLLSGCGTGVDTTQSDTPESGSGDIQTTAKPLDAESNADEVVNDTEDNTTINVVGMSNVERAKLMFSMLDTEDENALFSPTSLEMALGLVTEGATGKTREELLKYLGTEDYSKVARTLLDHADEVTVDTTGDDEEFFFGGYKIALRLANSLWVNDDYTLKEDFIGVAQESYDASAQALDFGDGEGTAQVINDWCDETTEGLIKGIVSPDAIKKDLALILCNSLYFESAWNDPWNVAPGKFTNSVGEVVTPDEFLYSTEDTYYFTDNAVAFGKRYMNGCTFIGILPDENVSLGDIDLDMLLESKTREYEVHAAMPKLDYEFTSAEFVNFLQRFGVVEAFGSGAEFGGIVNESDELFISDIIQKCKIELDENGTKAAAVTAIMMTDNAVEMKPPVVKEVILDRPFYYMIVDEAVGQVLFIGSVNYV